VNIVVLFLGVIRILVPNNISDYVVKGKTGHIQAMKAYRGSKGIAPLILTRDTGWKRVSTSMSRSHHAREGRAQPIEHEVK
jgi:hypothetical protein